MKVEKDILVVLPFHLKMMDFHIKEIHIKEHQQKPQLPILVVEVEELEAVVMDLLEEVEEVMVPKERILKIINIQVELIQEEKEVIFMVKKKF